MKNTRYQKTKATVEKLINEARSGAYQVSGSTWIIPKLANMRITFCEGKKGNIDSYIRKYYENIFNVDYTEKHTYIKNKA